MSQRAIGRPTLMTHAPLLLKENIRYTRMRSRPRAAILTIYDQWPTSKSLDLCGKVVVYQLSRLLTVCEHFLRRPVGASKRSGFPGSSGKGGQC